MFSHGWSIARFLLTQLIFRSLFPISACLLLPTISPTPYSKQLFIISHFFHHFCGRKVIFLKLDTFRRTTMVASKVRYNLRTNSLQKGMSDIFAYNIRQKSRVRNLPKIADLVSNLWWHSPGSSLNLSLLFTTTCRHSKQGDIMI